MNISTYKNSVHCEISHNNDQSTSNNSRIPELLSSAIDESFDTLRQLIYLRKEIEHFVDANNELSRRYNISLSIYRLPDSSSGIDRLIKEQKEERSYAARLLVKIEKCYYTTANQVCLIRAKLNAWDDILQRLILLRHVEKKMNKDSLTTPTELLHQFTQTIQRIKNANNDILTALNQLTALINVTLNQTGKNEIL